jgi:hypothetical protein
VHNVQVDKQMILILLASQLATATPSPVGYGSGNATGGTSLNLPRGISSIGGVAAPTSNAAATPSIGSSAVKSFSPNDQFAISDELKAIVKPSAKAGDRLNPHFGQDQRFTLRTAGTSLSQIASARATRRLGGGSDSPSPEAQTYDPRDAFAVDPRDIFDYRQRALENPTQP